MNNTVFFLSPIDLYSIFEYREDPNFLKNPLNVPLSELGRVAAPLSCIELLRNVEEDQDIEEIHTSPFDCCIDTTNILLEVIFKLGLPRPEVHVNQGLVEGITAEVPCDSRPVYGVIMASPCQGLDDYPNTTYMNIGIEKSKQEMYRIVSTAFDIINRGKNAVVILNKLAFAYCYHYLSDVPYLELAEGRVNLIGYEFNLREYKYIQIYPCSQIEN
jgi:hypothetical protein